MSDIIKTITLGNTTYDVYSKNIVYLTAQEYAELEAQSSQAQHTGVYDPELLFVVNGVTADYDNIRDIVAPTEYSEAVDDHAVGDEFILGNDLYKAVQAITEGDTITPGTNAALAGTIVSQLKALFEDEKILRYSDDTINDCNVTNNDFAIKWYRYNPNSAHAPSTYYGILIEIHRYTNQKIQIAFPLSVSEIYYRRNEGSAWPTTGNYGWNQIYSDKKWTTLYNNVSPTSVTLAGLQIDKYYLYEVIVYIGGGSWYAPNCFFNNVKNTLRKRIYTVGGWYADIVFNLWSNTSVQVTGYNNSGVEQTGTTVTINAREK